MSLCPPFAVWVESEVVPFRVKHPNWARFDGKDAGSSLEECGRFLYKGKTWVVHSDTRIDLVLLAHKAIKSGHLQEPFDMVPTRSGARYCLELNENIRPSNGPKYFYVYCTEKIR